MGVTYVDEAVEALQKSNASLEPELMESGEARELMESYARAEALAAYGKTVLARKVNDAVEVAKATGTSVGKAKATVATGEALATAEVTREAMKAGQLSADQAAEISRAEVAAPGSAEGLLQVAQAESFQVLREASLKVVLEAEQHRGLGERQREARNARTHTDALGMVDIHLRLQPHIGTPIVNRAEAAAARLHRAAKKNGEAEPFEAHLADAYAQMLAGSPVKGRAKRPELVVLVSHEVAKRGWIDVQEGEVCKIPGVGPVAPEVAKAIGDDAFLNGVFYDGTDLRHFKRWTRNTPVEVRLALELGEPPEFDGEKCVVCGRRFRAESDHEEPHVRGGPASAGNLKWKCNCCHEEKTERDRKAGRLKPGGSRKSGKKKPANKRTEQEKPGRPTGAGKAERGRPRKTGKQKLGAPRGAAKRKPRKARPRTGRPAPSGVHRQMPEGRGSRESKPVDQGREAQRAADLSAGA